jgi:hypothetical protein
MRRSFLLIAFCCAAWSTGAMAGSTKITFDNFCDGMEIGTSDSVRYVSTQTGKCLDGVLVMGTGYKIDAGKKDGGPQIVLGVNWEAWDGNAAGSEQYAYRIQYPYVTGGSWEELVTTNGSTVTVLNTGTYTVVHKKGTTGPIGTRPTVLPAR